MTVAKSTTKCPFCKETILEGAVRCRHCHADLAEKSKKKNPLAQFDHFRYGFMFGVLFCIVLAFLAYLQFYD